MRIIAAALAFALAACAPPSGSAPDSASASTEASATPGAAPSFAIDAAAIAGQWSFDRSCGLYDLTFNADNTAYYFDYANPSEVVTYTGTWALADHRIALTLNKQGEEGSPLGETEHYVVDVTEPVGDDLVGSFGQVGGAMRTVNAKHCPQEDRD